MPPSTFNFDSKPQPLTLPPWYIRPGQFNTSPLQYHRDAIGRGSVEAGILDGEFEYLIKKVCTRAIHRPVFATSSTTSKPSGGFYSSRAELNFSRKFFTLQT
ncbi:hypothetical protein CDAR_184991 [Caerostris darwini]|uniref:Uncharacterized protein n=1 Tax=Caerostris darwini TaxID=1538125 RepID=A0AAV4ST36_9ARAC|nr:hypothetical protein CDAR_184991 [Caerostris darwini]